MDLKKAYKEWQENPPEEYVKPKPKGWKRIIESAKARKKLKEKK